MTTETTKPARTLEEIANRYWRPGSEIHEAGLAALREAEALTLARRASPEEGRLREAAETVTTMLEGWGEPTGHGVWAEALRRLCAATRVLRSPPAPTETRPIHLFVSPMLTTLCGLDLTKHDGHPESFAKDGEPTGPAATSNPQLADCVPCLRFHARALEAKAEAFVDLAAKLAGKAAPPTEDEGAREACGAHDDGWADFACTLPKGHDEDHEWKGKVTLRPMRAPASSKEGGR